MDSSATLSAEAIRSRPPVRQPARALAGKAFEIGRALAVAASGDRGGASGLISVLAVFLAGLPFAGWRLPLAWLLSMVAVAVAERHWSRRRPSDDRRFDPFAWLSSAGYSLAAFYLVLFHNGPAQTLGVTLYGVVMFKILARDFAVPRRLITNLSAPIASMTLVQIAGGALMIRHGAPWQIVTLLASPVVVFQAFRAVQRNLTRSLRVERRAVARAEASEARYRLLAERSPDVIIRYDLAGRVEYLSEAARAYGWAPETMIGVNLAGALHADDQARNTAFMDELAAGRRPPQDPNNVWRAVTPAGRVVAFESRSNIVRDEAGRPLGVVAILRDITEREAVQGELERRRAEAEAAAVAKSEFLANMSHEIRTPLTAVIGFAGLLRDMDALPPPARTYVQRIATSSEGLLMVVNDILDFSKLEAGQIELDAQPFDPGAFVRETAELVREQAARKGLALTVDCPSDLPTAVMGDAARLRQVLLNLITNAVKFTEKGEVTVEVAYLGAGETMRVAVRDTGVGIPPDRIERLFQRFSQVDTSSTRRFGGTGLGLAISKSIVELMGGTIDVTSRADEGSTFWFEAPAPIATAVVEPVAPIAHMTLGPTRVLVVDDVAVNRELVYAMLAPFDVDLTEAESGGEAVAAAMNIRFDLILMDLQMPGMDGVSATRAIRSNSEINRSTPIIALSANVLPAHVDACRQAGMDDHIGKPINPGELLTKIAKWTSSHPDTASPPIAGDRAIRASA